MPVDHRLIRELFFEAAELPADQRSPFLTRQCNGNGELRAAVELLLSAHDNPASILDRPAPGIPTAEYVPIAERPGSVIGPYKLLEQIGEGGFGLVFVAEQQEPVRRKVALKIVKPGMDSRQVVARFEAERQALAMMDHVNIAKVLDAGTTDSGRPYFVMELVHGVPITEYCDANTLTPRERLELFVPVCHAIQHAHQKGIIHRDIKPSNILVTMYDDRPVPKVIDFGIAKAVEQRLTEKTLFTQYGALVGTFEYMSPEQAELNAFGVDTRSDVYSLGVLLYELLTGSTPLERQRLRESAFGEIVRIIKEEEPPKPSQRLSTSGTLGKVAAARKMEPAKLPSLVRGELDWIVMRCLEKDRSRRYETANGLARDVQRYLAGDAVEACPPTFAYRLQKLARRHRREFVAGAAFALLVVSALGVVTWKWQAERTALAVARKARLSAEAAQAEANGNAEKLRLESERLIAANNALHRGEYHISYGRWPEAEYEFSRAIEARPDHHLGWLARSELYLKLGLWDLAFQDLTRGVELGGTPLPSVAFHLALFRLEAGDVNGHQAICDSLLARRDNDVAADRDLVIRSVNLSPNVKVDRLAILQQAENPTGPGARQEDFRKALTSSESPGRWYFLYVLGAAQFRAGKFAEAVATLRESLASTSYEGRCMTYPVLAMALHQLGLEQEAIIELANARRALDEFAARRFNDKTRIQFDQNWHDVFECRLLFREAQQKIRGTLPAEDARLYVIRARAAMALGRVDLAESAFARAAELAPEDYEVHTQRFFFLCSRKQWDLADAELAAMKNLRPTDSGPDLHAFWHFGKAGRWDRANAALAAVQNRYPLDAWNFIIRYSFHLEQRDKPAAEAALAQVLAHRPDDPAFRVHCGHQLARIRQWSLAAAEFDRAIQLGSADPNAWINLAQLLIYQGDKDRYRRLCQEALRKWGQDVESFNASIVVQLCTLTPDAGVDPNQIVQIAQRFGDKYPRLKDDLCGKALLRAGRFDEALSHFTKEENSSSSQQFRILTALCHFRRGEFRRARYLLGQTPQSYRRVDPNLAGSENWSSALEKQIIYREAESVIHSEAWKDVDRLVKAKQWSEAIRLLDSSLLPKEHHHADDWAMRGECHAELGRWREAAADFAQALAFENGESFAAKLSLLYLLAGDRENYQSLCRRLVERYQDSRDGNTLVWVSFLCTYADCGKESLHKAIAMTERALAGQYNRAEVLFSHEFLLYRAGRFQEAISFANERSKLRPQTQAWDNLCLALAHLGLGETAKAREFLQLAIAKRAGLQNQGWFPRARYEHFLKEANSLLERAEK